jgi:uracil DNA glycosylase
MCFMLTTFMLASLVLLLADILSIPGGKAKTHAIKLWDSFANSHTGSRTATAKHAELRELLRGGSESG